MKDSEAILILEKLASIAGGKPDHYIYSDEDTVKALHIGIEAITERNTKTK